MMIVAVDGGTTFLFLAFRPIWGVQSSTWDRGPLPWVRLGASINGRPENHGKAKFREGGSTSGKRAAARDLGASEV